MQPDAVGTASRAKLGIPMRTLTNEIKAYGLKRAMAYWFLDDS